MDLTKTAFVVLLACVGVERLVELQLSRRHQRDLASCGARKHRDPQYRWMVALHAGVLMGAAVEVILLHRPFIASLSVSALLLFLLATLLRWWVIRTLGVHWNTEVVDSASLGVVSGGPFRWIRHPNYLGVFVELIALPLIHTAWITAGVAAASNLFILRNRLRIEERLLDAVPAYRAAMAGKPRFLPKIFSGREMM
jgi:methyltransferase